MLELTPAEKKLTLSAIKYYRFELSRLRQNLKEASDVKLFVESVLEDHRALLGEMEKKIIKA